ncbi:MAG: ATP-binding protein [Deltaproteobacteria bacterium]|nr:ATP-binding protein [Deltaproteobacteria bacterium]
MRTKLFIVFASIILLSAAMANRFLNNTVRRTAQANVDRALRASARTFAHLAASVPEEAWAQELTPQLRSNEAEDIVMTLFDRTGKRVTGVDLWEPKPDEVPARELRMALTGKESFSRSFLLPSTDPYLVAFVPVRRRGDTVGAVRASINHGPTERTLVEARTSLAWGVLFLLIVAAVCSWIGPRLFSGAISDLMSTATRMAKGDLQIRSVFNPRDPLAPLAQALDLLASNLAKSLDALKAERDLVGRILERMEEGVLVLTPDRQITLINPALRDVLLPKPSLGNSGNARNTREDVFDVRGRTLMEVFRHAELATLLDRSKNDERVRAEIEVEGLRPRRLMVTSTRFREGGYLVVFVDVTDIRKLESLRRDFVANVSHELRTPVASIRSASETLPMAISSGDPSAALRFVDIIERNAERLQSLVEDLLDLSKIEAKEYRLAIESLSVPRMISHIFGLFRDRAERRKISLVASAEHNLPALQTDRRALETVLSNLVDNAVKYCPDGARICVNARVQNEAMIIEVEDSGHGIESQHLPRLFERFYRVDAGRSRSKGGTGLGLSIVKHLTEAMGGTATVASTVGKGTTFTIRIPLVRTDAKPSSTSIEDSFG